MSLVGLHLYIQEGVLTLWACLGLDLWHIIDARPIHRILPPNPDLVSMHFSHALQD